jgi:carbon-monoxide dehydrogenase medium subunit
LHNIDYIRPKSIDEAIGLLAENGDASRVLAGGTDVLIQLREHVFDQVNVVIDIKAIPELNQIDYDPQSGLTLGAAVPCYQIYNNSTITSAYPGLVDAASLIGGTQIQGRASLGGNLCNAAPSGDSIPAMIALGGIANIAGPNGKRSVPVEEFCTAPRQTVLQQGEMLVSLHFPAPAPRSGAHYLRFIPRNEMDIAVAGVGASVVLNNGTIESARISLASVAPTPLYVKEAEDALVGKPPTEDSVRAAAELAKEAASPITDMRGTADFRKHLCEVLTRRALLKAIERAKEND